MSYWLRYSLAVWTLRNVKTSKKLDQMGFLKTSQARCKMINIIHEDYDKS
jgi:hypothetical protein